MKNPEKNLLSLHFPVLKSRKRVILEVHCAWQGCLREFAWNNEVSGFKLNRWMFSSILIKCGPIMKKILPCNMSCTAFSYLTWDFGIPTLYFIVQKESETHPNCIRLVWRDS